MMQAPLPDCRRALATFPSAICSSRSGVLLLRVDLIQTRSERPHLLAETPPRRSLTHLAAVSKTRHQLQAAQSTQAIIFRHHRSEPARFGSIMNNHHSPTPIEVLHHRGSACWIDTSSTFSLPS